jgi:dsDNA-binding SOS-regulon protein
MMTKEKIVTLKDNGRPLAFKIRQFPATKLERWINRLVLLLAKGGREAFNIPLSQDAESVRQALQKSGLDGIVKMLGGLSYEDAAPLYDELLSAASLVRENYEQECSAEVLDGNIEDVKTIYLLRWEILKLNFSFLLEGGRFQPGQPPNVAIPKPTRT